MEVSIRDPIHEGIICSEDEKELINSPLVQRLKWVAQLSLVNQVYNGATHSRFAHSLGAMDIAGKYMEHLLGTLSPEHYSIYSRKEFYVELARTAGLLHDIGHGPFSHSFDHVVYKKIYGVDDGGHDVARIKLLDSPLLKDYLQSGICSQDLRSLWTDDKKNYIGGPDPLMIGIINNIVEGPLGADRIDFTRRDSYNTGMQHLGTIPQSRIIHASKISFIDGIPRLSYHVKLMDDIIRTLDGRLSMYTSVYLHKTSVAATLLVEKMMDLICEPLNLIEMTKDPEQFKRLTDHKIFAMISEASLGTSDGVENIKYAQELYERLMDRKLPKMNHEVHVNDFNTPFDENNYINDWYPNHDPASFIIYKSRPISGISADKFDKYNIYFHDNNGEIFTCGELLERIGYTIPIKPYYIVRGYSM